MRLLRELNNAKIACTFLIGAKSQEEVFFENTADTFLDRVEHQVIVSTDDGSYGRKGYTTDIMTDLIKTETFDAVYTCGPEIMMKKVLDIASARSIPVQAECRTTYEMWNRNLCKLLHGRSTRMQGRDYIWRKPTSIYGRIRSLL